MPSIDEKLVNGLVNSDGKYFHWSEIEDLIHPHYHNKVTNMVTSRAGLFRQLTPSPDYWAEDEYDIYYQPVFKSKSGVTLFFKYIGRPNVHQVDYCRNVDSEETPIYAGFNLYTEWDIEFWICEAEGDWDSGQKIADIAKRNFVSASWWDYLTSGAGTIVGNMAEAFHGIFITLSYGKAYTNFKGNIPYVSSTDENLFISVNNNVTRKIDVYLLARGGRFASGGDGGHPYWIEVNRDLTWDSLPTFSIPYDTLGNYLKDEDFSDKPPGFENDTTEPGGGNPGPSYNDYPGDDIGFPPLPTNNLLTSGLFGFYNPNAAGLSLFADWLWSDGFLEAALRAFKSQPLDAVVYLGMLPFNLETIPSTIQAAGLNSNIPAGRITQQYYILDFGTVDIPEKWRSIMDYKYTKISIYLPYVGIRNIDHEIAMSSKLSLKYYVDALTGDGVAMLMASKSGYSNSVYYTWDFNMLVKVPLTGVDRSAMISSAFKGAGAMIAGGIAMAFPPASAAVGAGIAMGVGSSLVSSAANMNKQDIKQSGSFTSQNGALSEFKAYVIIEQPVQSLPKDFGKYVGFTANFTAVLNTLSGYTVVDSIHLSLRASDEELDEICRLLREGVVI